MRRISCLFIIEVLMCFISCCLALAQGNRAVDADSMRNRQAKTPHIVFDEREHDFGRFSPTGSDTLKTHTFTFRNTGGSDLVILHAVSGCGCTKPEYTKKPVKPGEKGTIKVSYRGEGQLPGFFRKSVTVYSNDPRSYVRIFIKGELVE